MEIVIEGSWLCSVLETCCQQWEMNEVTLRVRKTGSTTFGILNLSHFLKTQTLPVTGGVLEGYSGLEQREHSER